MFGAHPAHADADGVSGRAGRATIAEGSGEFSKPEKARFYRIARRSATECAAVLDVAIRLELVTPSRCEPARELLIRIVSMLVNMARALHR